MDHIEKIAHFIPCKKTHDASNVELLYFQEDGKLHGVSKNKLAIGTTKSLAISGASYERC